MQGSPLGDRALSAKDTWGPDNTTYEEAIAWQRLLGLNISITLNIGLSGKNVFWISRRGMVPWMIDACSPDELIVALKNYATENPVNAVGFVSFDADRMRALRQMLDEQRVKDLQYHKPYTVQKTPFESDDAADAVRYATFANLRST